MKKTTLTLKIKALAAISLLALSATTALAVSGNWTNNASSTWGAATNWSSNPTVPGTAAGDMVGLNDALTAPRTITLNVAATVGSLNMGDPIAPFYSYSLAGSSTLTFNNSGNGATLAQTTPGGANDTNSAPIALSDNLTINNVNGLTLSGVISSATGNSLTKTGGGTLVLSGLNTFTGGAVVNAGTLTLNNGGGAACLKNNSLTINPGATVTTSFGDAIGYNSGQVTSPINIYGGTFNDAVSANEGYISTFNLMGGTMSSTGGGAYNLNGASSAINTLATNIVSTISGPITLRANGLTITVAQGTVPSGIDLLISGAIGGSGDGFVLAGSGTLALTGTNTYSGSTTINGGTLQIGDGVSANGTVVGNLNVSSGTLVFANPTGSTYAGALSGSAAMIKTGAGTLTLGGANNFSGVTVVSNGLLVVATAPNQSVGSTITVADGAGLGVNVSGDQTFLSPSSLTIGSTTGGTLQFGVNGTTQPAMAPGSLTINGTVTINIVSAPGAVNSYPLIANYTGGALVLGSQPNDLLGNLSVLNGTVYYTVTNFTYDTWVAGNGNWDTASANWTNPLPGTYYRQGDFVQFDDTPLGAGPFAVTNTVVVQPAAIKMVNTKSYSISGLAMAGSGGLTLTGSGSLTLLNTNTFTGPTTIAAGELVMGGGGQLGAGTYAAAIDDETALVDDSSANQTLSGVISGAGSVTNYGSGTLTLSGANTFSGGVTITNGTVALANGGGAGSGQITLAGGRVLTTAAYTINNNIYAAPGTASTIDASGNFSLYGGITGSGTLTRGVAATQSLYLFGDDSGFVGTYQDQNNAAGVTRFSAASSGSASAHWIFNQAQNNGRTTLNFSTGTIYFGSVTGAGYLAAQGPGIDTVQIGDLGLNEKYSGVFLNSGATLAVIKSGTGTWTVSGANTYTGGIAINSGAVNAGIAQNAAVSGPFGASGTISFGGGTLQYSSVNQYDYSPRIAGSTAPISIDVNGTNVTFATALPNSNTGGLTLTNSLGTGKLTLTSGANLFTGSTVINAGTLALSGVGNIPSSSGISIASGATYDVSGVSGGYALGGSQSLSGSGVITGAVATAGSGSTIIPATPGVAGVLTFNSNLNLSAGAVLDFDLSTSHSSGNDQIAVGGNLTLGNSDAININVLNGAANLDQTGDYVLFSVAGTVTMSGQPGVYYLGTQPANFAHYSVQKAGNNVVLHYSASTTPTVISVMVSNTVDGSATATRYQTVTIYASVSPGAGSITNVSINLSSLGGPASQTMNSLGNNNYSYTAMVGVAALVGSDLLTVTATDTAAGQGSGSATLTVNPTTETWDGMAANANWGSGANWVGNNPPGYSGDSLIFTGSTQTNAIMNNSYNLEGITFDGLAGNFTLTNTAGTELTLNGTIENDSSYQQTLNVPLVLGAIQSINDNSGNGVSLGGTVSGTGGFNIGSGIVTFSGSNSFSGGTTVSATLKVGGSTALPNGAGVSDVSLAGGVLDLNGTNVMVNGLNGTGTLDDTSPTNASTLTIGNENESSSLGAITIQNSGGTNLSLVKIGTGDLALASANTFGGGVIISNGSVTLGNTTGGGTGVITLAGGTLFNNANITIANNILAQDGTTSIIDNGAAYNLTLAGGFMGGGTITRGSSQVDSVYLNGDNSGFTGIYQDQNSASSITRFATNTAGSAGARWIFNQAQNLSRTALQFTGGTIRFGSVSGAGYLAENGAFTNTVEVGALGLNDTFTGSFQGNGGMLSLTKVGTGTLTMSGANVYNGLTTVSNGTLVISTAFDGGGDLVVNDNTAFGVLNEGGPQTALLGNLTLGNSAGPTSLFFANATNSNTPMITASAAVIVNGLCHIAISNSIVNSGGVYPLIEYGSVMNPSNFVLASLPAGVAATLTNDPSNRWLALNVSVGNGVSTTPTNITTSVAGNRLTLSWPADHIGWRLQTQTSSLGTGLSTNWVDVPGATTVNLTNVTINPANGSVFFRMVYP